jgi:hypothetical protein
MTTVTISGLPPCRFRFDDGPTWEGFAHGSTWNGFGNVAVTRETLDKIVAWSMEQALDAGDAYQQFERAAPVADVAQSQLTR